MPTPRVFNPDDYLQTAEGRIYTEERNAAAWEQMYADLESLLSTAEPQARSPAVVGRIARTSRPSRQACFPCPSKQPA